MTKTLIDMKYADVIVIDLFLSLLLDDVFAVIANRQILVFMAISAAVDHVFDLIMFRV